MKKTEPIDKAKETSKPPVYEKPEIVAYDGDRLIKELGPAQACSPFIGAILGC